MYVNTFVIITSLKIIFIGKHYFYTMMANQEELKTMIKCFRVYDLQILLSFAGRSRAGNKQDLQERALSLLQLKSQPLFFKIKQLYDSIQKGYKRGNHMAASSDLTNTPASTTDKDDGGNSLDKVDDCISILDENESQEKCSFTVKPQTCTSAEPKEDFQRCSVQPNPSLQLAVNQFYYPIHPDVRFKKLPFYKVLYELLRPSSLLPQSYHYQQRNSFVFYLTPQQAAAISLSRDPRPGMQQDFTVQGQLRFCLLETTSQQDDSFPTNLVVKVNNKYCNIQEPPPKKKKDIYVKEPSPPINITPLMKISPAEGNKVEVQWNTEYGRAYVVGIFLVQKKTSEDLLNRLKAKGIRCADYTRGMIKDKLNEEADSEIVTTSLRVSLTCPLGKMKLRTPCRASTCEHLQCFDASLFLQMNEKKPTWMCPVCDNPAEYDKLIIDGYFHEILSSGKLPPEVNEIEFHNDGSWSSLMLKSEENSNSEGSIVVKVENEEIVDVVEEESKCSSSSRSDSEIMESNSKINYQQESLGNDKRKVDEIDLTISDSDDEPLIWYKRRESSKNKRNCVIQSNRNSNRSSPSVINLDSDSSDSLPLMVSAQFPILSPHV